MNSSLANTTLITFCRQDQNYWSMFEGKVDLHILRVTPDDIY